MTEQEQTPDRRDGGDRRRRKQRHRLAIPDKPNPPWYRHPLKNAHYYHLMFRWRMAVATTTHPVGVALAIAMLCVAVPVWMLLDQNGELKRNAQETDQVARKTDDQADRLAGLVREIQTNRRNVSKSFCDNLNAQARANNKQLVLFQTMIVGGAKSSVVFENLYRTYGAPPYSVRLAQAKRQAAKIERLALPQLDCNKVERDIEKQTPVPPTPNP